MKAEEREDAVFECLLSQPLKKITWKGKNIPLEQGEKFDILVSEDMLIHTLVVKDCMPLDKGIYAAVAGMASCSAWLVVEGKNNTFKMRIFFQVHKKYLKKCKRQTTVSCKWFYHIFSNS